MTQYYPLVYRLGQHCHLKEGLIQTLDQYPTFSCLSFGVA